MQGQNPFYISSPDNPVPDDQLRTIMHCWDHDDMAGEEPTCEIAINPPTDVPWVVLSKVVQRARELFNKFESDGNISYLRRGIHIMGNAIVVSQSNDEILARLLPMQSIFCRSLFSRTEDPSLLDRIIEDLQVALVLLPRDASDRLKILDLLAEGFGFRYKRSSSQHDLDEAIKAYKEALELWPLDGARPLEIMRNLGHALWTRCQIGKDLSDAESAIHIYDELLPLLDPDHAWRPGILTNLGAVFIIRYEGSNDIANLERGIRYLKEAISSRSDDSRHRPRILSNLGAALSMQYNTSGRDSDLEDAIYYLQEALSLEDADHPDRLAVLTNIAGALHTRYWRTGDTSDLEKAIPCLEEAISSANGTHSRPMCLNNLAIALSDRYRLTKNASDLDRAIHLFEQVPSLMPKNHPTRPQALSNLGTALLELFRASMDGSVRERALRCFEEALISPNNHDRVSALWNSLTNFPKHPSPSDDIPLMFNRCIELANHLPPQHPKYAQMAALIAPHISTFMARELDVRQLFLATGIDPESTAEDAALALFGKGSKGIASPSIHQLQTTANRLRVDWERVVHEIRALDGFKHFLKPAPFTVLQRAAIKGPVIFVNISKSRSDAVIVTSDRPPTVVPLEFATPDQVDRLLTQPLRDFTKPQTDRRCKSVLKVLWELIVEPIVTALRGSLDVPKSSRIWWCPTNATIRLPFHAAGIYQRGSESLPSLYTSSYTPTLEALIRAREGQPNYSRYPSILLVGQPNTPGQVELPQVSEEIRRVRKRIPHSSVIMDDQATRDIVLSAMASREWVHLSCHGNINRDNPLLSHFALYDGSLSLLELMKQRLPNAELAFLSACYSAADDSKAPDEFLHLAAAMQFAGFKSVVGTMWVMVDDAGPILADEFYRRMLERKDSVPDHTKSARALGGAVKMLRKEQLPMWVWINFVHWGA
ncbi:hypothetical protein FRB99_006211 [Tulasnella sp. 403]|nr:hypothetical protein FRB99_006211 [Tulasnella sp. 403]